MADALKYADINIGVRVEFRDNGEDDLRDQAEEAFMEKYSISPFDYDSFEIIEIGEQIEGGRSLTATGE